MINEEQSAATPDPIAQCIFNYKTEADEARKNRMVLNRENYDSYHMRQDYSHKERGQSQEFLPKQANATESVASFLQQGLMDTGNWFDVENRPGVKDPKILASEVKKLLERQLDKNSFPVFFSDSLKTGLLASLMIVKVGVKKVPFYTYKAEEDPEQDFNKKKLVRIGKDVYELSLDLVRDEDYFPDPNVGPYKKPLYEVQRITMDYHELLRLAEENPGDFDMDAVRNISSGFSELQKTLKARETAQNPSFSQYRKRVEILECWGTLVDQSTGKILHENCVTAISSTGHVVRPPKPNPFWHKESPFVVGPILRVPNSRWHRAFMDGPTKINRAQNEVWNLMVDGAMSAAHGIKQVRPDWLENQGDISEGIPPGKTLAVNAQCPPGGKVLERVDTGTLSPEVFNMYNLIGTEGNAAGFSNDFRMGSVSQRQVKATELIASNQAITGIFNGIVKNIESQFVQPLLEKCWLTLAQVMNDLDSEEVKAILGEARAAFVESLSNEELFADTASGRKFKVYGLSQTLNKIQDYKKIMSLLQTIGTSPMMLQEFQRAYSMTKLMAEVVKSLDIDEDKIKLDDKEKAQLAQEKQEQMQMQMAQNGATEGGRGQNPQSQIPQVQNQNDESNPLNAVKSMINRQVQ